MLRLFQVALALIFSLIFISCLLSQSVNLPLEHWAYQLVERLETKGLFKAFGTRSLPMSRMEIATILSMVEERAKKRGITLTDTEHDQLEQLKGEFHEELEKLNIEAEGRYHERHLFSWSEKENIIHADFDFGFNLDVRRGDQYPATERTSHTTLGGILRGSLKESLGFHIFVRNTIHRGVEITARNFDPSRGTPISYAGKNVYTDEASAYLVWELPWFQLEVGRDKAKWGPGYRGSLMLSSQNPLFDMIKLKTQFNRFDFTSIHGHLNSSYGRKYLAAHRLEIKITPWLYIAGSEAVVYGNRGIEFQYLNPIMPYHVAEHHLGDRDNNAIGFDMIIFPIKNFKSYFELFIDDYNLSKSTFNHYGNKFAFLLGGYWVEPFGLKNIDCRVEYARVEPFVYTHHDTINTYQNYNQSMGHWLGPNADDWFFEVNYSPNRDLNLSFTLEQVRKGEGDIAQPWNESYGKKKQFLSGVVERRYVYGFKITDQIFRDVFLSLQAFWVQTKNLEQIAAKNSHDTQVNLELLLNY
ncbi:MAG: hypothetical protein JSW07_12040 [bacterium]|nr:MAG: hypothetical protein JSW07_12040 [bacterium]